MRMLKTIVMAGLFAMLAVSALTATSAIAQTSNVAVESAERDRYIVVFNDNVGNPAAAAAALARQHGFTVSQVYTTALKGFAATLPERAVAALGRDGRVSFVEADQLAHINAQIIPTGVQRIFADDNANITINGYDDWRIDVDVAVIDTGVIAHPDINLFGRADCTGNPFNTNCVVNAGNDGNGHGTHVAGTIGAIDAGDGVVGVAPGARIWAIKVLKDSGSGWYSNIIGGVDYITSLGVIEVANMSLGGGTSDALCTAIRNSVALGITYAVAAGNDDADAANSSPANCKVVKNSANNAADGIITVSALADFNGAPGGGATPTCRSDEDDTLANFSNWGSYIDIAAPGVCILSTWNDGGFNTISGTSMAAPHVAGAAALLAASGSYTPSQIHAALVTSGNLNWTDDSGDGIKERLLDVINTTTFNPAKVAGNGGGTPVNHAPTVTIDSPADGTEFASGSAVNFSGTADDAEDGDLTAAIKWTSETGAQIGTGGSGSASFSDGSHTITASVTDKDNATGSASVTITVGSPPSGITMYVADISMQMKGPNLDTIVTIRADTDGSRDVSGADAPVAGVVPEVRLCKSGGSCYFETATVSTDSNGNAKYKLLKPSSGSYTMDVIGVADSSGAYLFDGAFPGTDTTKTYIIP